MLIDIKPRTNKPLYGSYDIDWSHPLTMGLKGGVIFSMGSGTPMEIIVGTPTTFTTSMPRWRSAPGARYAMFFNSGLTQAVTVPMAVIPTTATGQTWAFGLNVASQGNANAGRIMGNGVVDNTNPVIRWNATAIGDISIFDDRSIADANCTTSGANITVSKDCHIVITDDQTTILSPNMFKAYFNGISATLVAGGNGAGTIIDPASMSLGGLTSVARSIDGVMYYFYKWSRVLTHTEALWLKYEPYAFFKPRPAIWYSFTAGQAATASTRPPSLALTGVGI